MPVVWITGSPGTGKSRVLEALVARGFIAFDADKGIARWRDRSSGEAVWAPPARTRPATWHRDFTRRLERDRVQEIIENAGDSIAEMRHLRRSIEVSAPSSLTHHKPWIP